MSTRRPRLLVLTQYYRPEPNFITADVAEALAVDFDVTVVTAHPNYPRGRFYDGVRSPWRPQRTAEGAVTVWRLPLLPYHGNSIVRRGLMYLTFAAAASVVAPFVAPRPDVVWVYQTPFTTALAALWFRLAYRVRLVYTCADLWPESLVAANLAKGGLFVRALFRYRRWVNRLAHTIIASTRGTARRFVTEGVPPERIQIVPVWVESAEPRSVPAPTEDSVLPSIVYAGNLGPAQELGTLVRAAAILARARVPVTVDLYGSGSCASELQALAASLGADNVRFHGRVSPAEAFGVSRRALGQVVSLRRSPLFDMTVPSKLAFCFAAGAPILAGLSGEAAEIAASSRGALAFDPDDPEGLASAIQSLLALPSAERQAMREQLRLCYERDFARSKLLACYREILRPPTSESATAPEPPAPVERAGGCAS